MLVFGCVCAVNICSKIVDSYYKIVEGHMNVVQHGGITRI
jgi:hypothetical protein